MAAQATVKSAERGSFNRQPGAPSARSTRKARVFTAWWPIAALLGAAIVYGFLLQPPRPDPFVNPTPLISLDWWFYPMPHRAMTAAGEIPVGTRGTFVSRPAAERLRFASPLLDAAMDSPEHGFAILDPKSGGSPLLVEMEGQNQNVKPLSAGCTRIAATPKGHSLAGEGCPDAEASTGVFTLAYATTANTTYMLTRNGTAETSPSSAASPPQQMAKAATSAVQQPSKMARPLAQQTASKAELAGAVEGVLIVFAPNNKPPSEPGWKVVPTQRGFGALDDLAVANDDGFGIAVGNDGVAFRFDTAGHVARIAMPFNGRLTSVHIAADGSAWTTSAADESGHRTVLASFDHGITWDVLDQRHSPAPWVTYLAVPLFLFAVGGGVRRSILRSRESAEGTAFVADIPTNDSPIGLKDHDSLNFRPIARALELFIRNINTEPPLIIAITGEWGSGKSSLMNITKEMLERDGARPVWFNSWHHQNEESLLAALLENIREQAIPRFWTWPGLSFRSRLLRRRLTRELRWMVAFAVLVGALVFLLTISGYRNLSDIAAARDWVEHLGNLDLLAIPVVLAVPILAFRLLKLMKVFPDSVATMLAQIRRPKAGDIRDKLNFRYRFAREFEETADVLRTPLNPGLVIFIDDLDRCRPENVVEILEAVNFVSGAGKCVIVLGMSKRMVSRAIWRAHEDLFKDEWGVASEGMKSEERAVLQGKHRAFSENYLEKLINIELALPVPSREQSEALLAPPPDSPGWQGLATQIRSLIDWVYELGPSLVTACLLLLALYFTPQPTVVEKAPVEVAAVQPNVSANPQLQPTVSPGDSATTPVTTQVSSVTARLPPVADLGAKYADHNWAAQVAIALVCALLVLTVAVRYLILASRPKVSDTLDFDAALRLWAPVVREARPTPRFLKRYKNRVRYFAMRMRPIPEEPHPAERLARWLLRRLKLGGSAEEPTPAPEIDVHEADIVALTALRVVDPALVAPRGKAKIADRLRDLSVPANDDLRREMMGVIALTELTLQEHESRYGPVERDKARFNEVDPQDPEDGSDDRVGRGEMTGVVEGPVKAA
jgi:KAP family P-loop domain